MSLKAKMAAFQAAAEKKTAPSSSKKTTTPIKKIDVSRSAAAASVITPRTAPSTGKGGVRQFAPGTPPEPKKLFSSTPTRPSLQEQANSSDKAKTALVAPKASDKQDWKYLYELACQFDILKAQEIDEAKNPPPGKSIEPPKAHEQGDKKNIKGALEGLMGGNFTANGNFLTEEYIGKHLVENKKFNSLSFDFSGQNKLFKRFDRKDAERRNICTMFVDALLKHPQAKDITQLHMANCLLPDEFLEILANKCREGKLLPKLQVLNLESNLLAQEGMVALGKAIADPQVWRNLQFLKLENQKMPFTSTAEEALGEAVLQSPSLVLVSLSVRGGLERQQINNTVAANTDNLRQARREHAKAEGTLQERKRNEMEQYFDKIAANDSSITSVDIVGDIKFLGLNPVERTKTGAAFASNTHVTKLKLVKLKLDDAFAEAFGKALATNFTLEQVVVDSNEFSGAGIKSLMEGLGKNSSIIEFQVRHQTKTTSSSDEQVVPDFLANNKTVTKLGIDLRNQMAKMQVDRKLNENREHQRKLRAAQKK